MRPVIPREEYDIRLEKVQNMMAELGLDLVAAYADDRFVFGQAYSRWLVDYQPKFEPALVLVPAKGEIAIATGGESIDYITTQSICKNAYVVSEFLHPEEEFVHVEVISMKEIIKDMEEKMGRKVTRVGVPGISTTSYSVMESLHNMFGKDNVVDIEESMSMLRAVKTENELEVIRYAYKIAEAGMKRVVEILGEGITEREIAAEAEYVMRKMGSEGTGIDTMVASGVEHTRPIVVMPTDRELRRGDLVVVTLAPRYKGYHGAIARPFFIGEPSKEMLDIYNLVKTSHENTRKMLRPGIAAKDVDRVSRQLINEAGLGNHFTYTGVHSTGVIEFEIPVLSSDSKVIIEKNMVLSIDIPIFLTDWGGMRLENGYIIKENETESLINLDTPFVV